MPVANPALPPAFHIMTKPIGPICNLDCKYCFYLEKEKLYPDKTNFRMPDNVLERYIQQYIESQTVPEISFAWQGGEPTLMGLDFFQRAVDYQQKYAGGKKIINAFQTNGTLLDDAWCEFFKRNEFLIGLSIDGPRAFHDKYRVDKKGQPTFELVMAGMRLLKKHGVEFNTLCVVNRANSKAPLEVYNFLKTEGSGFMQFIPLVERQGNSSNPLDFAAPPMLAMQNGRISLPLLDLTTVGPVTPWSVDAHDYGNFLVTIFDYWVRNDVGRVFVQIFDVQLAIWAGLPAPLCVFGETCGNAMALEHNGDLYSCDHYVYPQYHLGNILDKSMGEMVSSLKQRRFGQDKSDTLPKFCRECDVRFACNGECPKHRFIKTPDGEAGLNYLCAGYKKFLRHIDPHMTTMAELVQGGRPAAEIMGMLREKDRRATEVTGFRSAGRNDPCPCGSGKKFKKCCWDKAQER
jgi:uncharacterized protein